MNQGPHQAGALSATVVVCTGDRPAELARCLAGVRQLAYRPLSILVVDSAPRVVSARSLASQFGADYLHEPLRGLSRARNRGAAAARTDIVAFLDDDSVPDVHWLERLADHFGDPAVVVVTGPILPPPSETPNDALLVTLGRSGPASGERHVLHRDLPNWFAAAAFGAAGDGGNMAFRRSAFERWGGFDPRFGRGAPLSGGEEHLAFVELLAGGSKLVYEPAALTYHPVPGTRAELRTRLRQSYRDTTANFLYWIFERPEFRGPTLRVIGNGLRRRLTPAAARSTTGVLQVLSLRDVIGSVLAGFGLYLRSLTASHRTPTAASSESNAVETAPSHQVHRAGLLPGPSPNSRASARATS